ncbi:MAG: hypothetical protein J6S14_05475 [Clostridia bacterium]|nr:hypothetical protein [Clostridia bacterium]
MNSNRIKECTDLSCEILKNFELSEIPVGNIILKCLRLCRLLGDQEGVLLFTFESSGYPRGINGKYTSEAERIAVLAHRGFQQYDYNTKKLANYLSYALLSDIESCIETLRIKLAASVDPDISLTSANPNQYLFPPAGNSDERSQITSQIQQKTQILAQVKGALYNYVLTIYNKLVYGNIVEDIFTESRMNVNQKLGEYCPKSIEKFVSVYENLSSDNPEDYANAVHSCRRILLDLADALYPPSDIPVQINGKSIKVGADQYINRLIQYISSKSGSKTYNDVVGSDLSSIGMRLDAINDAVCKGTHTDVTKDEATRYIIHTYLLISDIVSL